MLVLPVPVLLLGCLLVPTCLCICLYSDFLLKHWHLVLALPQVLKLGEENKTDQLGFKPVKGSAKSSSPQSCRKHPELLPQAVLLFKTLWILSYSGSRKAAKCSGCRAAVHAVCHLHLVDVLCLHSTNASKRGGFANIRSPTSFLCRW